MDPHHPKSPAEPRLYFRQWLAGRDFAADDPVGAQMANYVYAVGDAATGEAVLIDPVYEQAARDAAVAAASETKKSRRVKSVRSGAESVMAAA